MAVRNQGGRRLPTRLVRGGGPRSTRRPLGIVGRVSWGVADQGVSSLSNFALGIVVARSLDSAGFGAFSLAYVTYAFILSATRGLATDPLLVRFSGSRTPAWRRAVAASTATAAAVGVVGGAGCVLVGLALHDGARDGFVALGIGLPLLMLQDSWRFVFFSAGQPAKALVNDLVWGVLLLGVLVTLAATDRASVFACVLAFGATAGLAAGVGLLQSRVLPRPTAIRAWVVDHRDLGSRYLVENLSIGGARQVRMVALGAFAGLAAVGDTRAAEILMGPFLVILMGASQVAVPEASQVLKKNPLRLGSFCFRLGLVLAVAAVAWAVVMLLVLPTGLGAFLLGPIWEPAHALLPPVAIGVAMAGFLVSDTAGVRALGAARRSLAAQLANAAFYLVGGSAGAFIDGARGSCWGVAIATTLGAVVWRIQLRRAIAEHVKAPSDPADPTVRPAPTERITS